MYKLGLVQVTCGNSAIPTASVKIITEDGETLQDTAIGIGPIDAVYQAINRLLKLPVELIKFKIKSVTGGTDAIGEAWAEIKSGIVTCTGRGTNKDIIVASAEAYINAINRLLAINAKKK